MPPTDTRNLWRGISGSPAPAKHRSGKQIRQGKGRGNTFRSKYINCSPITLGRVSQHKSRAHRPSQQTKANGVPPESFKPARIDNACVGKAWAEQAKANGLVPNRSNRREKAWVGKAWAGKGQHEPGRIAFGPHRSKDPENTRHGQAGRLTGCPGLVSHLQTARSRSDRQCLQWIVAWIGVVRQSRQGRIACVQIEHDTGRRSLDRESRGGWQVAQNRLSQPTGILIKLVAAIREFRF